MKELLKAAILALLITTGCSGSSEDQAADTEDAEEETASEQHNVLKEYVNTPKEAARGAAGKVEAKQAEAAEKAKQLSEE